MIRAAAVTTGIDLRPLLRELQRQGVRLQVTEESGRQVIWTPSEAEAEQINRCLEDWRAGRLLLDTEGMPTATGAALPLRDLLNGLIRSAWYAPVSVVLIALCLAVALASGIGSSPQSVQWLFFPQVALGMDNPLLSLFTGLSGPLDVLRMFTPALLHFGVIHLLFNTLWLWFFGRMIEALQPSLQFLGVVLFTAFWGNVAQFLWSGGQINFGGMSGVVYGLIGYIWMWQSLRPHSPLRLPTAMIGLFLVALVLMEVVGSGWIATAAHVGGLVSGMLAGLALATWNPGRRS